eukprot:CAMPEP_0117648166 /NCGR_PEP_ID=MMETSP0804-20121206/244_1 /TAXON_ID=1074897 /ORGANISM="Tetraselmis astigmatica, Strain CCMP880" /LENGTH=364 /DNA_ID=CAMNT_0005453719 /DNA_START=583 /DNA_END=1677 /DNA_ORIENTATION=+
MISRVGSEGWPSSGSGPGVHRAQHYRAGPAEPAGGGDGFLPFPSFDIRSRSVNDSGRVSRLGDRVGVRDNALALAGPLTSGTGGVNKRRAKPRDNRKANKRSKKASQHARATALGTGTPPLAALMSQNKRSMKRYSKTQLRKFRKASQAAAQTPGGMFPVTPKFVLGAPTMKNENLMMQRPQPSSSVRAPSGRTSSERGILGINDSEEVPVVADTSSAAPGDLSFLPESLDYFGSNEGLIVPRALSSPGSASSGSEEGSESEEEDEALRGMELHLEEAQDVQRQRQQELRINHQAEYIVQLEDDNLMLRRQVLTLEEELDKARRKEDEHLNLQERMYLLEEELQRLRSGENVGDESGGAEDGEI